VEVLRVFNNNVILARDAGEVVVLTGRGLGFYARVGQPVDVGRVVRRFVPTDGRPASQLGALLAEIPPEHVALAAEAVDVARAELGVQLGSAVIVALADHINFAIRRARQGLPAEYPLAVEVAHLYPRDLAVARRIVELVNERLDLDLPMEEAVPITLHLVNAGFATEDMSRTFQMTTVFEQVFSIIEEAFGRRIDSEGVNAARFVTHLRYFFVRVHSEHQFDDQRVSFVNAIRESYREAYACAIKVQAVLQMRLGQEITDDEVAYLTMHIARLTAAPRLPQEHV
jgi:beta-glucoside operon transcriptional antiterminator